MAQSVDSHFQYVTFLNAGDHIQLRLETTLQILTLSMIRSVLHDESLDKKTETTEDIIIKQANPHNNGCYQLESDLFLKEQEDSYLCLIYACNTAPNNDDTPTRSQVFLGIRCADQLLLLHRHNESKELKFVQPQRMQDTPSSYTKIKLHLELLQSSENNKNNNRPEETEKAQLPQLRATSSTTGSSSGQGPTETEIVVIVFAVIAGLIVVSSLGYMGYLLWKYMQPLATPQAPGGQVKSAIQEKIKQSFFNSNSNSSSSSSSNDNRPLVVTHGEGSLGE